MGYILSYIDVVIISLSCNLIITALSCHDSMFTNCTYEPCEMHKSCKSWENITCTNDYCGGCKARYYTRDGAEIDCNEALVIVCKDDSFNMTCPAGLHVKVWYAYYGRMANYHCNYVPPLLDSDNRVRKPESGELEGRRPPDSVYYRTCVTSVLTELIRLCDHKNWCNLNPSTQLTGVSECQDVIPYLQLDYACIGAPKSSYQQEQFFKLGLLCIGGLFPLSLTVLLVTVTIRKKRSDIYKLSSMHMPLTENENPEV